MKFSLKSFFILEKNCSGLGLLPGRRRLHIAWEEGTLNKRENYMAGNQLKFLYFGRFCSRHRQDIVGSGHVPGWAACKRNRRDVTRSGHGQGLDDVF
jgi:hypothetical protein